MKYKKIILSLMLVCVLFMSSMTAFAVKVVQVPSSEIDSVYNQNVDSNAIEGWAKGPHIYSEAGIVMDAKTGAILYAKNIDDPHYPASITKVLTGLVAIENSALTDIVTVKQEDWNDIKKGDNHIGLKVGEEITMEDALHGTLLASGNEVAHAIASNIGGGYEAFLKMMNDRVKELGGTNSNFVNTHGLHSDEHYTTAHDMALIGAAAIQNETFRKITGTKLYTIPETNITNEKRAFENHHKMLFDWRSQYYEYCIGGKTGYTDKAMSTLITFAEKDGVTLVAVVLRAHGSGNAYVDTKAMLNYAFDSFTKIPVTNEMVNVKGLEKVDDGAYVSLPSGVAFTDLKSTVTMPTEVGDMEGTIAYTYKDTPVGKVGFTITKKYHDDMHGIEEPKIEKKQEKEKEPVILIVVRVILILFFLGVLFFLILFIYASYKRRQRRKRRAEMRKMRRQQEYQRLLKEMEEE